MRSQGWQGHCPICKRPLIFERQKVWAKSQVLPEAQGRYAYVINLPLGLSFRPHVGA